MATIPLIPTIPVAQVNLNDSDDESSDDEEITIPEFDLNAFDDSDNDDDEDEDEDDASDGGMPAPPPELAQLMNLAKPVAAFFPTGTQRVVAQAVVPATRPTVPLPTPQAPVVPQPAGLRMAVLPTTAPAMVPVPTLFPAPARTAAAPAPTTLTLAPATVPTVPTGIPQLAGLFPTPQVKPAAVAPMIPQLAGLTLAPKPTAQPTINVLPARPLANTVDVTDILAKMPNVSIMGLTANPAAVSADINDLLQKETDETAEDFEARRRLTLKLASIPDYKLSNVAAVTAGFIMMKKAKLGLTYDPDVEAAISYLTALLQR